MMPTFLFIIILLSGCGRNIPTPDERVTVANNIAKQVSFNKKKLITSGFDLFSLSSDLSICKNDTLNVYIEGDGLSWITSRKISPDPTPINPLALRLAIQDTNKCVIYIARPCQYINTKECSKKYWTSHRFSKEVIDSYNESFEYLKDKYKLKSFKLFGYSGGGAVVALLASRRTDIDYLVTIAGNLDTNYWIKKNYLTLLSGSLNPADFPKKLENIKQYHFIGGDDDIIDFSIYKSYASKFKNKKNLKYNIIKNNTHNNGWVESWEQLLKEIY
jgi:hypothetical protein